MTMSVLIKGLSLALGCLLVSFSAVGSPASIRSAVIRDASDVRFKTLMNSERDHGNFLIPKRVVRWGYEGHSGEFLLAEVKSELSTACVVYMWRDGKFISLGGNDRCTWGKSPKIVSRDKKMWIDFRPTINRSESVPSVLNEITANFRKGNHDVCILGLPGVGYEGLRCPDDEAPDSQ